jgi:hypothetical protein
MKTQRLAIGLTVLNLVILMSALLRANSAPTPELGRVLRGRALEIVDDQGCVRAMIRVFPVSPTAKMPDGTRGYPETVLLRLINSLGGRMFLGRPRVAVSGKGNRDEGNS